METLIGSVKSIVFESQQSDFKVFTIKRKDHSIFRVTGEFPQIMIGAKIEVHGEFKSHPKYGMAFKADAHTFNYDGNAESICLYIQSIAKWVGPQRSYAIAEKFGSDIQNIIENNPERLMEIEGIGEKIAESIADAWKLNRNMKDIQVFLHGLGLGLAKIRRIINMFGAETEKILTDNPWILCQHGFGFTTCDYIANKLEKDMHSDSRFRQFILYTLLQVSNSGHLFLYPSQLLEALNMYNKKAQYPFQGKDFTLEDIAPHVRELVSNAAIVNDQNRIYELSSFFYENESAKLLTKILNTKSSCRLDPNEAEAFIERYEAQNSIALSCNFKLSDEQKNGIRHFFSEKVLIITGFPGSGKCLGKDTPVLMFDGTIKKVQDIVVGDLLMGDDSTPREVLTLARGEDNLYKVTPIKGDSYVVNSDHILSLKESPDSAGYFIKGKVRDVSVKEYLKMSNFYKHHLKGYRVPVEFKNDVVLPIDPYLIGFWLGNGSKDVPRVSTPFKEALDYIDNLVEPLGLSVKKVCGDNVDYGITCDRNSELYNKLKDKHHPNLFLDSLRALNLIENKHIPDIYKFSSRENRLKLIAGIIDSDGYSDKKMEYDLLFTNKKLAEDVVFLVKSLGFAAYLKECYKKYNTTKKGHHYSGVTKAYRFSISGESLDKIPVVVKKRMVGQRKQKKDVLVTGIKVEPCGYGDYYGFEITGNGRFLLGDFTVTHNTTLQKAIVQIMKEKGIKFELMTPTGIAAKKLANTVESDAYTIHRRLGYKGNVWDFNNTNKYSTDVIVVDEVSMIDQEVFYRLLSAIYSNTKIVFVGDNDQLPSVGPGCVLKELIESKQIKTVFLDKIFRQDKCSEIVLEAKKIRDGDQDLTYFRSDPNSDIWHISDKDEKRIENTIVKFAQQLKEKAKEKNNLTFQVITPRNEGSLSVFSLNTALQQALNPPDPDKMEIKLDGGVIRKGDRVLIRKNNYELGVFNGDIGKVVIITPYSIVIDIEDTYDQNRRVEIQLKLADDMIKLAYCLTCHKVQGSEYSVVILPLIKAHGSMLLQRNLLYTAITRAKKKVVLIGQTSAIEQAINNDKIQKRNTLLAERIGQWKSGTGITMRSICSHSSDSQNNLILKQLLLLEEGSK